MKTNNKQQSSLSLCSHSPGGFPHLLLHRCPTPLYSFVIGLSLLFASASPSLSPSPPSSSCSCFSCATTSISHCRIQHDNNGEGRERGGKKEELVSITNQVLILLQRRRRTRPKKYPASFFGIGIFG